MRREGLCTTLLKVLQEQVGLFYFPLFISCSTHFHPKILCGRKLAYWGEDLVAVFFVGIYIFTCLKVWLVEVYIFWGKRQDFFLRGTNPSISNCQKLRVSICRFGFIFKCVLFRVEFTRFMDALFLIGYFSKDAVEFVFSFATVCKTWNLRLREKYCYICIFSISLGTWVGIYGVFPVRQVG